MIASGIVRRTLASPRIAPLLLAVLALAAPGCDGGGSGQRGNAFVFLTVDQFALSGSTPVAVVPSSVGDAETTTLVCVTLRNNLKNPTVTAATGLDNVIVQSYTVRLSRSDGRGTFGPFTFNTSVLVPTGTSGTTGGTTGNTATFPVILVPIEVKANPSLRPPSPLPVAATADIVFRGRDGRGQSVEAEGSVAVVFVQSTTETASCAAAPAPPPPTPTPPPPTPSP